MFTGQALTLCTCMYNVEHVPENIHTVHVQYKGKLLQYIPIVELAYLVLSTDISVLVQ